MDKKNLTIGISLLVGAFAVLILSPKSAPTTQPANAQPGAIAAAEAAAQPGPTPAPGAVTSAAAPSAASAVPAGPVTVLGAVNKEPADAKAVVLENEFIKAQLTDFGGAVRDVALKKFPAVQGKPEPYVFNHLSEQPILALTDFPRLGRETRYEIESATASEVVFRAVVDGRLEVKRRYRLTKAGEPGHDPYRVHHETTFRNLTGETYPLPRAGLSIGTAELTNSHDTGQFLNAASYDGDSSHYVDASDFAGGLFGSATSSKEQAGAVRWAAVKNQFFASIYTTEKETPGIGLTLRPVALPAFADSQKPNHGITAAARFELPALAANATAKIAGWAYVGPLEYGRIKDFDAHEDRVFPYFRGFNKFFLSGFVSPLQNTLLNVTHRWVGNWGVAIIIMTLILKLVSLPFTIKASKSAKQMAKLQPLMQEIREKYKDNPQKQQMATMELFKTHKVNPLGGCIPILITFPLFIGFFAMLQGTAELRFQPFLWAHDLSASDTIGHLWGFPINIMPLLMGATMIVQMRLTPTPSVDNMQAKMMQFMPIIFIFFCYTFSCALSLYSTINGLFTIGQQIIINRMKDEPGPVGPGATAVATAVTWGGKKPVKNVTPKKK